MVQSLYVFIKEEPSRVYPECGYTIHELKENELVLIFMKQATDLDQVPGLLKEIRNMYRGYYLIVNTTNPNVDYVCGGIYGPYDPKEEMILAMLQPLISWDHDGIEERMKEIKKMINLENLE